MPIPIGFRIRPVLSAYNRTFPRTDIIDPSISGYFIVLSRIEKSAGSGPGNRAGTNIFPVKKEFSQTPDCIDFCPGGDCRFATLNGSAPTAGSLLYTAPLTITTSSTVKARVYQNGLLPSAVIAKAYFLVDNTISGFSSNLPLMIFSTSGHGIADHVPAGQARTFASLAAINTFRGRSSPLGAADYVGQCEIGIRGQSSASFPKKPYRVELQDAYRSDRNASFFGLPEGSDWILNNPYSDKPFLQNYLAQELFERPDTTPWLRPVEVFINTSGGRISYLRDYAGIYIVLGSVMRITGSIFPSSPL